jgi:formylglycine-generating enzyme
VTNLVLEPSSDVSAVTQNGMILIPAGEFLMGSEEGSEVEKPIHQVELDAYFIDSTPITNAQFAEFASATGYRTTPERLDRIVHMHEGGSQTPKISWRMFATPDRQNHPVIYVSWHDAIAYSKWVGKRLPTEAEWERAARGGLQGKRFPWGDGSPGLGYANWNQVQPNSSSAPPTTEVTTFPPNNFGVYDSSGNVWEWCADWYIDPYYVISERRNPGGPVEGEYRVRRGASWNVREDFRLRCANRGAMLPDSSWPNLGFRCAVSASPDR